MPRSLPPNPNLELLRKQAKDIVRAHKNGDSFCVPFLKNLRCFEGESQEAILGSKVSLVEAQFALAMEYGFRSWAEMRAEVARNSGETVGKRLDLAGMELHANMMRQDVFSLLNQRIGHLFGHNLGYEAIHCLSTNSFCPAIQNSEDCTSWWHHPARQISWDIVAGVLGLAVDSMIVKELQVNPQQSEEEFDATVARQKTEYPRLVNAALEQGKAVVVDGGWSTKGPHGFIPWVLWGVILEAGQDGPMLGATFNGHDDNPIDYVDNIWSVSPGARTLSLEAADKMMLGRAANRIRATDTFSSQPGVSFGLQAMDKWIRQMETVKGFCPGCFERAPDRAWGDANDNAQTMFGGAQSVSKYLRERKSAHQGASGAFETIAGHYDKIVELIGPAIERDGSGHYKTFIGDLGKQKEHAQSVLRPVKDEMVKAADAMEKAAAAMA